jgi:hypothetical protein
MILESYNFMKLNWDFIMQCITIENKDAIQQYLISEEEHYFLVSTTKTVYINY